MEEKVDSYNEILSLMIYKINNCNYKYYFSWWLREDLNNKYLTSKINYELQKAVKKGILKSKSFHYGIEYSINE